MTDMIAYFTPAPTPLPASALAPLPRMAEIVALVAERNGLTLEEIKSKSSARYYAWPRQEAMALCYATGRWSYPQIGRYFNRDHTTVLHARRVYAKRVAAEAALARAM